eukprot:GABV01008898.1.p1 GENE.GABV01008898.1~~GABV01008898.1.p1  ORF type:complete len:228 (-),score=37.22 GABV01008898.1:3-686(-)
MPRLVSFKPDRHEADACAAVLHLFADLLEHQRPKCLSNLVCFSPVGDAAVASAVQVCPKIRGDTLTQAWLDAGIRKFYEVTVEQVEDWKVWWSAIEKGLVLEFERISFAMALYPRRNVYDPETATQWIRFAKQEFPFDNEIQHKNAQGWSQRVWLVWAVCVTAVCAETQSVTIFSSGELGSCWRAFKFAYEMRKSRGLDGLWKRQVPLEVVFPYEDARRFLRFHSED